MIKIFKIIEKVVWTLVAIAVIMILALIAISVANSADNIWDDVRPYTSLLYGVAMLVVAFKVAILGVQIYLETKIEEKTKHLQTIIEKQQSQQVEQEDWNEWQANVLAAAILIPIGKLKRVRCQLAQTKPIKCYGQKLEPSGHVEVEALSNIFCVSKTAMLIRLRQIGAVVDRPESEYRNSSLDIWP